MNVYTTCGQICARLMPSFLIQLSLHYKLWLWNKKINKVNIIVIRILMACLFKTSWFGTFQTQSICRYSINNGHQYVPLWDVWIWSLYSWIYWRLLQEHVWASTTWMSLLDFQLYIWKSYHEFHIYPSWPVRFHLK